jgi:hypothetical protein
MRSFVFVFIALLTHVTCSKYDKNHRNSTEIHHNKTEIHHNKTEIHHNKTEIHHNETETEHHLNKRYYGKNQNRKGSNDVSVLVKRKVEKVERVDGGVHQNRNRGGR